MPDKWAYDLDNKRLMNSLLRAAAEAGVSGSGLIMDLSGSDYHTPVIYLKGVVLSRLEGRRPPFAVGDKARMYPKETYYCPSVNWRRHHASGEAAPDIEYEVAAVFYERIPRFAYGGGDDYDWTISFKDKKLDGYRFPVKRFEKVEQVQPAEA